MVRHTLFFLLIVVATFLIDQAIKVWAMDAVNGVEYATILKGSYIDLELHYNKGVAFSWLEFLGSNLKWAQLVLIAGVLFYLFYERYIEKYPFALGLIVGGAIGNLFDRFIHKGVVDYVAWHYQFDFAVFNYADVMINFGVFLILLMSYLEYRKQKRL